MLSVPSSQIQVDNIKDRSLVFERNMKTTHYNNNNNKKKILN